jgi:ribosomal protein L40E
MALQLMYVIDGRLVPASSTALYGYTDSFRGAASVASDSASFFGHIPLDCMAPAESVRVRYPSDSIGSYDAPEAPPLHDAFEIIAPKQGYPTVSVPGVRSFARKDRKFKRRVPDDYVCARCGQRADHWVGDCSLPKVIGPPPDGYICHRCHCKGHWMEDCGKQWVPTTSDKFEYPPESYTCRRCGDNGHWIEKCPEVRVGRALVIARALW